MEMPTPDTITEEVVSRCLLIYKQILEAVYATKLKDTKRRAKALEDDDWRYEQLPRSIKGRGPLHGLDKNELERLVQWKM